MTTTTCGFVGRALVAAGALLTLSLGHFLAAQEHRSHVAAAALQQGLEAFDRSDTPWDRDEAEKQFVLAFRAEPTDPAPLLHLARLHDRTGNDLTAIGWYRAYLAAAPKSTSESDVRRRLAALDAAAEKRASAIYELASGALKAVPPQDWFAFDPQTESLPWTARFLILCGVRNDEAKVNELLAAADPSWRDALRSYLIMALTSRKDWDGAFKQAEAIETRLLRWQGYCLVAINALPILEPDAMERLVERIQHASSARGDTLEQAETRAGENLLLLLRSQSRLLAGSMDEARKLFERLPAVPSADVGIPWFIEWEHEQTLALGEQFALASVPDAALAACRRADELYRRKMEMKVRERSAGMTFNSGDTALFMRQFGARHRIVRLVLLDARDSREWSRYVREIDEIDEAGVSGMLLERAELQARFGRRDELPETVRQIEERRQGREASRAGEIQAAVLRRVDVHVKEVDELLRRLSSDEESGTANRQGIEAVVDRQIREGDLERATQTLERIPRADARSRSLLHVLIARAARGEIGLAQTLALRIDDPAFRQRADVVLMAAIAQYPYRVDAVELLGPERAWSGIDLAAANGDIVNLLIARGQLAEARHVNLHQEDSVSAARRAGRIAVAELARGDISAADETVRQTLDRLYPRGPEPYLALADELALGRDILGLRSVARKLHEAMPYREYRFELLQVAQLQEYSGDAAGARLTREAADWRSLEACPSPGRLRSYVEYWVELMAVLDSKTLSYPPPMSPLEIAPRRDPLYFDVPQRTTDQKRILTDLKDQPPWDVFRRTTGLAEQVLRGLFLVR